MEVMVVIFIVIGIGIYFLNVVGHDAKIKRQIESLGGRLLSYERRNFFSGIGPFHVVGRGRMVYRIDYEVNGVMKEGWVRFGSLFGPDWRL